MDAHCEELLRIAERIEELSKLISVHTSQQPEAREGGQWVELPKEGDEPFNSDNYYIRRFALRVVGEYISALEKNEPVMDAILQLQPQFNERQISYHRKGTDFRSEFLKYLRLCGGDKCLCAVGGVFDIWTRNFTAKKAVNQAPNPDSVDEVQAFNSDGE